MESTSSPDGLYRYRAYGLDIASELPLPELTEAGAGQDVVVRLGPAEGPSSAEGSWFAHNGHDVQISRDEIGAFRMRAGREITVFPTASVDDDALRLFVTGAALGVILHQRGLLVLHGSAVEVRGSAVGFLGGPRWGKSTMAAALHGRGHGFVADDVLAVELEADEPRVRPGFPQLKLWPDAAAAVGHDPASLPTIHPKLTKRATRVDDRFAGASRPLRQIYLLDASTSAGVDALPPGERVIELVRHSYLAAILPGLGRTDEHLRACAGLAERVTMRRLRVERNLTDLSLVAELIEADLASAGNRQ